MDTGTTDSADESAESEPKPKRPRKQKVLSVAELVEQGMGRYGAGRKSQARESFTKAIELDPQCVDAWFGLALATNDRAEMRALPAGLRYRPGP